MNSALYAACAGLVARTQALDTIAANVANSSSNGFRGQANVFGTVLASAHGHHLSALNQATNSYGVLASTHLDTTAGSLTPTGNDLDLAIQGDGFFKIKTATGFAYTRNGAFQVGRDGTLTTSTGDQVLGDSGGPIPVAQGKLAVSADGTVSVNGALAGRLKVVAFSPATELASRGGSLYAAPESAETPAAASSIRQGALEGSNVSPVDGMVQLISAQRAAESMRHVLTMIDAEMDKTAAQDLPRVS